MTKNVVHYFLWRMVTYVNAKMLGSTSVILRRPWVSLAQVLFVIVDSSCFFVVFSIIIQTLVLFFLQSIRRTAIRKLLLSFPSAELVVSCSDGSCTCDM